MLFYSGSDNTIAKEKAVNIISMNWWFILFKGCANIARKCYYVSLNLPVCCQKMRFGIWWSDQGICVTILDESIENTLILK